MARNDISYAKSLYFCGVKNQLRHDVAGYASFFRADNLVGKLYPDECGNSNARKGSAVDTLTARIGILYCLKINCMKDNKIQLTDAQKKDAQKKVVESIQEYFSELVSVAELHERTAKALVEIIHVSNHLSDEGRKIISRMVDDHICLIDLIKPLDEKGGEV